MKYLKYFNSHTQRESFQENNNDRTLVHFCEDRNHLHYQNCSQDINDTPQDPSTPVVENGFNITSILEGFNSMLNINNPNIIEDNLNYIKDFYNLPVEGASVFGENIEYPIIGVSEQSIEFPYYDSGEESGSWGEPKIDPCIIPINGLSNTSGRFCMGYSLVEDYWLDNSIEANSTFNSIISNNTPIYVYLYINSFLHGNKTFGVKLIPIEYSSDNETNSIIYMSLPELEIPQDHSYDPVSSMTNTDAPIIFALRNGYELKVILPFQQFTHTHKNIINNGGLPESPYFEPTS